MENKHTRSATIILTLLLLAAGIAGRIIEAPDARAQTAAPDPCREVTATSDSPAPWRLMCGHGLDVNKDTARDLTLLPGIGESRANALVESRNARGPYRCLKDLERVKGIGSKTSSLLANWTVWENDDVVIPNRP